MGLMMIAALAAAGCGAAGSQGGSNQAAAAPGNAAAPAAVQATGSAQSRPAPVPGEESGLVPPDVPAVPGEALERGEIALQYSSPLSPERLIAWYHGAARHGAFSLGSELEEGAEHVLSGSTRRPHGEFTVRLAPGDGGGTVAMVLITAR